MSLAQAEQGRIDVIPMAEGRQIRLSGALTVGAASALDAPLRNLTTHKGEHLCFCLKAVEDFDTVGAWLIYRSMRDLRFAGAQVSYTNATDDQEILIEQALIHDAPCPIAPPPRNPLVYQLEEIGLGTTDFLAAVGSILSFFGLVLMRFARALIHPKRLRLNSLVHHMEHTGWKALAIVGLLCFLIGLVIVQQSAEQLRLFNAEVFVVDLIAVSTLRELGVLLTAIIAAGRSGSAFAAQIGSMKLQEEVDALRVIGLDPIDTLVLPRMLALIIVMPLLTFYANILTLAGGAVWAWISLDITPQSFIVQLQDAVSITSYRMGLVKAPVFGMVIAIAGCFNGLAVSGGAASVGERTTRAVVQSIFMVIVLDAFFAVFFQTIGW